MQAESILQQHSSVYSIVTEQILKQLESGTAPWNKPWTIEPPKNLVSKKAYRGINVFLLASNGYGSPYWLTYKQATERGGHVRKGQHGTRVVFWKIGTRETEDADGETVERKSVLLRYHTLFNVEQCEGVISPEAVRSTNPIEQCERIVSQMPNPPAMEQDYRAWYRPSTDTVGIPSRTAFDSPEAYYSTLFHELTHSTGHASRVGRDGIEKLNSFGSESYSKEELIAEMGAAMLCGIAGIERKTLSNSAAYLKSWIDVLKTDSHMVVSAASQAQKAADYIRGGVL
ncbi:MAG: zincin-like metallopeptidase domain-containing protein [Candidatus Acidiferrales bacterium]